MDKPLVYGTSSRFESSWGGHYNVPMGTPLFEVIIMVRFNRWISADEIDEYRECAFDEFHEDLLIKELS